ncbi:hypothetical protein PG996_004068 [Apiospora saccharicola]|uniref:Uncharacterized protein n=1 Tax=Apiospora saccharicola TaxID=335842 RepID=A0ABR1W6U9_9PEZI
MEHQSHRGEGPPVRGHCDSGRFLDLIMNLNRSTPDDSSGRTTRSSTPTINYDTTLRYMQTIGIGNVPRHQHHRGYDFRPWTFSEALALVTQTSFLEISEN